MLGINWRGIRASANRALFARVRERLNGSFECMRVRRNTLLLAHKC